ncbi:MAG TPA: hypothetical protein VFU22_19835 [Roseiflexaceae bacterium]|nr:hypothetical protein [Roseiflexaceae bacterium]
MEQTGQTAPLLRRLLPAPNEFAAYSDPELLRSVVVLEGRGVALSDAGWDDTLYDPADDPAVRHRAIPYYAWDNRATGPMTIWMHEQTNAPDSAAE